MGKIEPLSLDDVQSIQRFSDGRSLRLSSRSPGQYLQPYENSSFCNVNAFA